MRIRNSHGFANETDWRESDSNTQAFLILCESPWQRRFIRVGTLHDYSSPVMRIRNSHGFASQDDSRESDTHSHMPNNEPINTAFVWCHFCFKCLKIFTPPLKDFKKIPTVGTYVLLIRFWWANDITLLSSRLNECLHAITQKRKKGKRG